MMILSKENLLQVAFKIFHKESIDIISNELNLQASDSFYKGEKYISGPKHRLKEKMYEYSFWEYRETIKVNENLIAQELIDDYIFRIISPRVNLISNLIIKYEIESELFINQTLYNDWNPGFHFNKDIINIISKTKMAIDIDIYVFNKDTD